MKEKILAANARYTSQVESLLAELAPICDERLNRKPPDGGWSAMQTLHHLILVEENSLAYIRKKLSFNPKLEKSGLGAWSRMILLRITLLSPLKFKAPKSSGVENIPETGNLADASSRWLAARKELKEFFEAMPPELIDKAVYRHPYIGLINWLQMLDFLNLHFKRHREQIRRAIS